MNTLMIKNVWNSSDGKTSSTSSKMLKSLNSSIKSLLFFQCLLPDPIIKFIAQTIVPQWYYRNGNISMTFKKEVTIKQKVCVLFFPIKFLFCKAFWWVILMRHFDETFWSDILDIHFDETFDATFWLDI